MFDNFLLKLRYVQRAKIEEESKNNVLYVVLLFI